MVQPFFDLIFQVPAQPNPSGCAPATMAMVDGLALRAYIFLPFLWLLLTLYSRASKRYDDAIITSKLFILDSSQEANANPHQPHGYGGGSRRHGACEKRMGAISTLLPSYADRQIPLLPSAQYKLHACPFNFFLFVSSLYLAL